MSGYTRLLLVLLILVLLSGIGLVYSHHQSRQLFIELQGLQARRDELNIDWELLKLEESTLNTALMVDQTAHDRLHMLLPDPASVVYVKQ
ncbi:MAG TPA: cell division protein FtsL [Candidatus Competibacteraceae bacterium]|nr:cell division protein FtsL [Candidatus Competibacteraceae bacterium]